MTSYSFLKEAFDEYDSDDTIASPIRKRVRKNWHTPQSRGSARIGTLGSFASMTGRYNNVYRQETSNQ